MRGQETRAGWREFLPPIMVVIIGLLLAVTVFLSVRGYYANQARQQFRRSATTRTRGSRAAISRSTLKLPSLEPSST